METIARTRTAKSPSVDAALAAEFAADARERGWTISLGRTPGVVTIERRFTPGDTAAYRVADADAYSVLTGAPRSASGTIWGTDGGSVGGHHGLTNGYYRLSKSGVNKRFIAALRKVL